jgi:hypothetical protein
VQLGAMHTIAANFETSDPPQKVADFYRSELPNANVNVADGDHYTIVSTKGHSVVTVNVTAENGKTLINIATVSGKGVRADNSSSD